MDQNYRNYVIKETLEWLVTIYMLGDQKVLFQAMEKDEWDHVKKMFTRPLNLEDDLQTVMRINLN